MKNKLKILGVLIVMAIAICGAFNLSMPKYVFATETPVQETPLEIPAGKFTGVGDYIADQVATVKAEMNLGYEFDCWLATYEDDKTERLSTELEASFTIVKNTNIQALWKKAGTFTVEGADGIASGGSFFIVGESATLKAVMEPGFEFVAWTTVDENGETVVLSTEATYTFKIINNIVIIPTWKKMEYEIVFTENVKQYFNTTVENQTQLTNPNYYEDRMQITISVKEDLFVADLVNKNIKINNVDLDTINGGPMNVSTEISNGETGFINVVIKLNIKEDIKIDINYTKMFTLEIVSGNSVDIDDIFSEFINIEEKYYYAKMPDMDYTYLLKENVEMKIDMGLGNNIYTFDSYELGSTKGKTNSVSFSIRENKTFTVVYNVNDYTISFKPYLINSLGNEEKMTEDLYQISDVIVKPGDSISFNYNSDVITITNADESETPYNPVNIYGYEFVGFTTKGSLEGEYNMSGTNPVNAEIKMIFEYAEYLLKVEVQDDYFAPYTELSVTGNFGLSVGEDNTYKVIKGATIKVTATTDNSKYQIDNWQFTKITNQVSISDGYEFTFDPTDNITNDPNNCLKIVVNVDYKYTTAKFLLNSDGCVYDEGEAQYSASLSISHVEQINVVLADSNEKATVTFKGTTYRSDLTSSFGEIATFESNVDSVPGEEGKYKLTYGNYLLYLFMAGDSISIGDKVALPNLTHNGITHTTEFVYDGTSFVMINAEGAKAVQFKGEDDVVQTESDEQEQPEADSQYGVELVNVIPNAILIYRSMTTNDQLYQNAGFYKSINGVAGSAIGYYNGDGYYYCLLPVTMINEVSVKYIKVENKVYLNIGNIAAYSYDNVKVIIDDVEVDFIQLDSETGAIIEYSFEATDNQRVSISIDQTKINDGYKFDGYDYTFEKISQTDESVLSFVMDYTQHANRIINIVFSEIEYLVKVEIEGLGEVTVGQLSNNIKVKLTESYTIVAEAEIGYYTSDAYIGGDTNKLSDLITLNESNTQETSFELNPNNIKDLIIDNANTNNEVYLYVKFTLRTYSIKTYLVLERNADIKEYYPTVTINGEELSIITDSKDYYVEIDGITHGSSATILIDQSTFLEGIDFGELRNEYDQLLTVDNIDGSYKYVIDELLSNSVYKIKLKYIEYKAVFKAVDTAGNENGFIGNGYLITNEPIAMDIQFHFGVKSNEGYIEKEVYYYSKDDVKNLIESHAHYFYPKNFKIYTDEYGNKCFTIYIMFDVKVIDLHIGNQLRIDDNLIVNDTVIGPFDGKSGAFVDKTPKNLIEYITVERERDGTKTMLSAEDGYQVQMGDKLTITVKPISIGIALTSLKLGNDIERSFTVIEIYNENDDFTGVYYIVEITFEISTIERLYKQLTKEKNFIEINNNLEIRTYAFNYTYNYRAYEFDVQLSIQVGRTTYFSEVDDNLTKVIAYGTVATFGCKYDGIGSANDKYDIKGYSINGYNSTLKSLILTDTEDKSWTWEKLALSEYLEKDKNTVTVQLQLSPKIFLRNQDADSPVGEYRYTETYDAKEKGLIYNPQLPESENDVSVGSSRFDVVIKYLYNDGYRTQRPINAGSYQVKIIVKIGTESVQSVDVECDEKVTLIILQREIKLAIAYSQSNPFTKEYDGQSIITSPVTDIIPYIELNGVCAEDKNKVFINPSISVELSGFTVNETSGLYNLILSNIGLIDDLNNPVTNYKISEGATSKVFERIAKITPKELQIVGVIAYDKVNDGSTEVQVNIDELSLKGKIGTDVTEIIKENLKFYHDEVNSTFKGSIAVKIDYTEAILGADRINYKVTYQPITIDIYPYEIEYYVSGVGTFKIVDYDKKCLIPLEATMRATVHARGSSEYNRILTLTETQIQKRENLHAGYEILLIDAQGTRQPISEGLYIYIPNVDKTVKVFQKVDDEIIETAEYGKRDGFLVVKAKEGRAIFGVVVDTTYLPLWLIILIVVAVVACIALIVLAFVLVRRRSRLKYQKFDTI